MHVDANLFARQTWELGGEHERVARFAQVNGRCPSLRPMRDKSLKAVLDANQIAKRVPARIDHDRIVAWPSGSPGAGLCARLERFY